MQASLFGWNSMAFEFANTSLKPGYVVLQLLSSGRAIRVFAFIVLRYTNAGATYWLDAVTFLSRVRLSGQLGGWFTILRYLEGRVIV